MFPGALTNYSGQVTTEYGSVRVDIEGRGPAILVLHGTPGGVDAARAMARFIPRDRFRVLMISRPGYPGTPITATRSINEEARLLNSMLDALDIKDVAVLAWSGGAPAAYRLAVLHPTRVRGVAAIAGVSTVLNAHRLSPVEQLLRMSLIGAFTIRTARRFWPRVLLQEILKHEGRLEPLELREQVASVFKKPSARSDLFSLATAGVVRSDRRLGYLTDLNNFERIDDLELEKVHCPSWLFHGDVDTDVPLIHSLTAARVLPRAELVQAENGTHFEFWTQRTDEYHKRVISFFSSLPESSVQPSFASRSTAVSPRPRPHMDFFPFDSES